MIKQMRLQGAYLVGIATHTGCSESTVRRYLKFPEPPARKTRFKMAELRPFMDYTDMRLTGNVRNAGVILHEIRTGYTGGRSVLRYYIRPERKVRPGKKTVRSGTRPGCQLRHDRGEAEADVAGERCKINVAVNAPGYSRRLHVFAALRQDAEHSCESRVRAFRYSGGSVKTVPADNQKAAVLKNHNGNPVFSAGFMMPACGFAPRACRPGRAGTRGRAERRVSYLKENFFVRYRRSGSFAQVNPLPAQWLNEVADKRALRQFRKTALSRSVTVCSHCRIPA